jgi:hypothetical protein
MFKWTETGLLHAKLGNSPNPHRLPTLTITLIRKYLYNVKWEAADARRYATELEEKMQQLMAQFGVQEGE